MRKWKLKTRRWADEEAALATNVDYNQLDQYQPSRTTRSSNSSTTRTNRWSSCTWTYQRSLRSDLRSCYPLVVTSSMKTLLLLSSSSSLPTLLHCHSSNRSIDSNCSLLVVAHILVRRPSCFWTSSCCHHLSSILRYRLMKSRFGLIYSRNSSTLWFLIFLKWIKIFVN